MFRCPRTRCQTDDEAADLTPATFELAWRSRDRFRGDAVGYASWVYQIARRLAIDCCYPATDEAGRRIRCDWPCDGWGGAPVAEGVGRDPHSVVSHTDSSVGPGNRQEPVPADLRALARTIAVDAWEAHRNAKEWAQRHQAVH